MVELLGLPGAGKSTVGAALAAAEPSLVPVDAAVGPDVVAVRRLARKLAASAGTLLRDPGVSLGVGFDLARGQPSRRDVPARWVQWQQTQALLRAARGPGPSTARPPATHYAAGVTDAHAGPAAAVRLLDEGALQCLWSVGLRGDVEPLLRRLAASSRWSRADLVVVLDVPVAVAARRLAARPSQHSRTQALAPQEQVAELERGARLVEALAAWWPTVSGRHRSVGAGVVHVDGTRDPVVAVRRVLSAVDGVASLP